MIAEIPQIACTRRRDVPDKASMRPRSYDRGNMDLDKKASTTARGGCRFNEAAIL